MNLIIRSVTMNDLDSVVSIESDTFEMSQEMTQKDMIGRIENYPDTFLVAEIDHQVVGHVFGPAFNKRYIEDEIYFKNIHTNKYTKRVIKPFLKHIYGIYENLNLTEEINSFDFKNPSSQNPSSSVL